MLCKKPFIRGNSAFGCGQCLFCRINRRRVWTHRMMLEAVMHPAASFVTLTYEEVPDGGSLVPQHLQLWLKRFRYFTGSFRYYAVGEYGDRTERPHYHVALFGHGRECTEVVHSSWGLGHVHVGDLTLESAAYVAGYVTKKLTSPDDPRLQGRQPEFARMSLRPGIGAYSMEEIARCLQSKAGWDEIERLGDVPTVLRHGRKLLPLGRYLRRRLRKELSFVEVGQSKEAEVRLQTEMLAMFSDYLATSERPLGLKDMIEVKYAQKRLNVEGRQKIRRMKPL